MNEWKMTENDGKTAMNRNDFNGFSAPSPKTILMGSSVTTAVTTWHFTTVTTLFHFEWQPTVSRLRCMFGALPPLKSLVTVQTLDIIGFSRYQAVWSKKRRKALWLYALPLFHGVYNIYKMITIIFFIYIIGYHAEAYPII